MRPIEFLYFVFPFLKPAIGPPAGPEPAPIYRDAPTLTAREIEVAWCIYHGYSNEEIARELSISVSTVKTHVHNLLGKFRVSSRWALRDILREKWQI